MSHSRCLRTFEKKRRRVEGHSCNADPFSGAVFWRRATKQSLEQPPWPRNLLGELASIAELMAESAQQRNGQRAPANTNGACSCAVSQRPLAQRGATIAQMLRPHWRRQHEIRHLPACEAVQRIPLGWSSFSVASAIRPLGQANGEDHEQDPNPPPRSRVVPCRGDLCRIRWPDECRLTARARHNRRRR